MVYLLVYYLMPETSGSLRPRAITAWSDSPLFLLLLALPVEESPSLAAFKLLPEALKASK